MNSQGSLKAASSIDEAQRAPQVSPKVAAATIEHVNGSAKGESFLMDLVNLADPDAYCCEAELVGINQQYLFIKYGYRYPYDSEDLTTQEIAVELPYSGD
ncbi:hypothetical protein HDU93_002570 [Gonapodya sp. JEL0774]|nr:hypothetical protein HDU93_002570 [Gonapodya sp. JEL0774]